MFSKLRAFALAVVQEVSALLSPPESVQVCLRDSVVGPKEPLFIVSHFQASAVFSCKLPVSLLPCWQVHCEQSRCQD